MKDQKDNRSVSEDKLDTPGSASVAADKESRSEDTASAAKESPEPEAAENGSGAGDEAAKKPGSPEGPLKLVGVKFRQADKTYYFYAGPLRFHIGEKVIVETDRGLGIARIVTPVFEADPAEAPKGLKKVIRKANWNDLERDEKNRVREEEAANLCNRKIAERGLGMKLVKVEYLHDASKAIFYFTAEHRVDFRDLVKDLARQLHTRIEMRQIGVRDETKLLGGIGPCGRNVCCASFLTDFSPVSVRMAKDQNLAMNPAKVSGLCGRLMCCLSFEHELYSKLVKTMPKKGKKMVCSHGPCRVIDLNILARKVLVEIESGKTVFVPVDELKTLQEAQAEEEAEETLDELEAPEEIWESDDPSMLEKLEKADHGRSAEKSRQKDTDSSRQRQESPKSGEERKGQGQETQHRPGRKRGKTSGKQGEKQKQETRTRQQPPSDKGQQPENGKEKQPPAGSKPHSKRSRKRKRKKKST
ncbi:MAG: stage 0 sporulation family protein [bacterium]